MFNFLKTNVSKDDTEDYLKIEGCITRFCETKKNIQNVELSTKLVREMVSNTYRKMVGIQFYYKENGEINTFYNWVEVSRFFCLSTYVSELSNIYKTKKPKEVVKKRSFINRLRSWI